MPLNISPAFGIQISHLLLSSLWNLAGVLLIHNGARALGPTASLTVASLLIGFALLLLVAKSYSKWLYIAATVIIIYGAISAIIPAFQQPPSLWPSDFWRYAGVILNSLGVVGGVWALFKIARQN